jgi:hypothetical protein
LCIQRKRPAFARKCLLARVERTTPHIQPYQDGGCAQHPPYPFGIVIQAGKLYEEPVFCSRPAQRLHRGFGKPEAVHLFRQHFAGLAHHLVAKLPAGLAWPVPGCSPFHLEIELHSPAQIRPQADVALPVGDRFLSGSRQSDQRTDGYDRHTGDKQSSSQQTTFHDTAPLVLDFLAKDGSF